MQDGEMGSSPQNIFLRQLELQLSRNLTIVERLNKKAYNLILISGVISTILFSLGIEIFEKYPTVLSFVIITTFLMIASIFKCRTAVKVHKQLMPIGITHFISDSETFTERYHDYMKFDQTEEIIHAYLLSLKDTKKNTERISRNIIHAEKLFLAGIFSVPVSLYILL